jgi:rhodanese-related sulfurtransferase
VKFLIDNWMLIALALGSGGMLVWPMLVGSAGQGTLSPNAAVLLMNHEKAVVVDVCEAPEFAAEHIVGAKHAPLGELEQKLPTLVKNKALPLILVCASGGRSKRALAVAQKLGYTQAHSLTGGLTAWKEANLPTVKS